MDRPRCSVPSCNNLAAARGKHWGKECDTHRRKLTAQPIPPKELRPRCLILGCNEAAQHRGHGRFHNVCPKHHRLRSKKQLTGVQFCCCENCGWNKCICDRHRIIEGSSYTIENVRILCPNCHRIQHYGIRLGGDPCELCGWDQCFLDDHRILPGINGGLYIPENISHICPNCHRIQHHLELFSRCTANSDLLIA